MVLLDPQKVLTEALEGDDSIAAFHCVQGVSLAEVGVVTEKPLSSDPLSFSPQEGKKGEGFFVSQGADPLGESWLQTFNHIGTGPLRQVNQWIQKSESRESLPESKEASGHLPCAYWMGGSDEDIASVREFFPTLPLESLAPFKERLAHHGSGEAGEFFHGHQSQVASFHLDRTHLTVTELVGPWQQQASTFLSWELHEILGREFVSFLRSSERDRFVKMLGLLKATRPLINMFELESASGERFYCEVLMDDFVEGGQSFYVVRVNREVGALEDHLTRIHQQRDTDSSWPRWLIVPWDVYEKYGDLAALSSKLQSLIRRPYGAPDPELWVISQSPLSTEKIQRVLSAGIRVWVKPLPFRLMARLFYQDLHRPSSPDLNIQWSPQVRPLFQKLRFDHVQVSSSGWTGQAPLPLELGERVWVGSVESEVAGCKELADCWQMQFFFLGSD